MTTFSLSASRVLACLLALGVAASAADSIPRFGVFETAFTGPDKLTDPYRQVAVSVTFTGPASAGSPKVVVDAFWDGGSTWRVRMSPTRLGQWSWRTVSATRKLDGLSGRFVCIPSLSDGFLRTDSTKPGLFFRGSKPVFLLGCSGSALSDFNLKDGSFQKYIDSRLNQGFNCLYSSWLPDLPVNEAGAPFSDLNTLTPNPVYFQAADQRMYYCRLKGVAPIIGIDLRHKDAEALWHYIIARYSAFDVVWYVPPATPNALTPRQAVESIRKFDPYRHPLMTAVKGDEQALAKEPWHDVILASTIDGDWKALAELVALGQPVLNNGANLESFPEAETPVPGMPRIDVIRPFAWRSALAGAYPVYRASGVDPSKAATLNSPGARTFELLGQFFGQTDWSRMVPAQDLISRGDALVRARPDAEYIVWLPQGGPITLDVSGMKEGFWVQWFDPRTGKIASSIQLPARQQLDTQAPDNTNDWVLHLSRVRPRVEQ